MSYNACEYCGIEASYHDVILPNHIPVPCCEECYVVISRYPPETLAERRRTVKRYLREKYNTVLNSPEWTETQLAELGPSLRLYIEGSQQLRQFICQRLAW